MLEGGPVGVMDGDGVGGTELGVGVGVGEDVVGVGVAVLVGFGLRAVPTSARGGKLMTFSPARAPFMNAVQTRAG